MDVIPEVVSFRSHSGQPVEVVTLDMIRSRASAQHLASVQRPDFVMLLMYTAGHGTHVVDFERFPVQPGALIVVAPGRTHQFQLTDDMQGTAVVVDRAFVLPAEMSSLRTLLSKLDWHAHSILDPYSQRDFLLTCENIVSDTARFGTHPLVHALLRERLYAWLVLMHIHWSTSDLPSSQQTRPRSEMLTAFRALIGEHYLERWTVADYAKKLGYSERTLTRACLEAEARSAKEAIDARLLLEVRRWLANSDETLEAIAYRLNFGDASNLVQFFRRLDGGVPSAFRGKWRLGKSVT